MAESNATMPYNLTFEASYMTPYSPSPLLYLILLSMSSQKHTPKTTSNFNNTYDYIVVGGGAAGSVIAARLSELACATVLLLEAGKESPKQTDIPVIARVFSTSDIDWGYNTAPQKHCGDGHLNRVLPWPSGKTVGGSSVINAMLTVRGNRKNFDDWEEMGAKGWNFEKVLPYFMKLEDNVNPEYDDNEYRGDSGPVTVSKPEYESELQSALYKAPQSLGYEIVDSNGPRQTGFYAFQATLRNGQRCSAAKAYLVPAEDRPNLDIVAEAFVKKIIIENNTAVGVLFDFDGKEREVRARKEVILTAGTVNSAQLLMLSGIGPKEELQKHNIPVIADLPVGKNFQDHWATALNYELSESITPFLLSTVNETNIKTYIDEKKGPMTSVEGVAGIAFLPIDDSRSAEDFPDYQLFFAEGTTVIAKLTLNFKPEYYDALFGPYEEKSTFSCLPEILQPKGRGEVTLRSANPYDPPVIDPNYFSNSDDLEVIVAGMKKCDEIANTKELKSIGTKPFNTTMLGCENLLEDKDEYYKCYAKSFLLTLSHQTSTVTMGDPEDPKTVVDPKLKVKFINNLRVADASVMPLVTSGNTLLPTLMVAEKASDLIKENITCQDE